MGFRIGAGVGPFYVSKSIGGRRRRRGKPSLPSVSGTLGSIDRDMSAIAAMRAEIDAYPDDQIRKRHAFGWVVAGIFAVMFAVSLYGIPFALLILGWTWWGHRQRWQRVAARRAGEAAARADAEARAAAQEAARHLRPEDRAWLERHQGRPTAAPPGGSGR